jgi:hypothetical protein
MRWLLAVVLLAGTARADECPQLTVSMTPSENLQIVAWLEDAAGNYVDTIFITDATGLRGIGNRPGQFGMKSGPLWPYGKRLDVFPIWAHRHGQAFPMVVWQSFPDETGEINAPFGESSREAYFCRPLVESEAMWTPARARRSCSPTRARTRSRPSAIRRAPIIRARTRTPRTSTTSRR